MHSVSEWLAQLPAQISPRDGLVFIRQALDDAKEATDQVLAEYHGGTLPPPPWPQPPRLVFAIKGLEGGQIMLQRLIDNGAGDRKEPQTGPYAVRLIAGGRELYAGIADMQREQREGKINPADVPAKAAAWVAHKAADIAAGPIGGLITFAAIVWLLRELDAMEDRHAW